MEDIEHHGESREAVTELISLAQEVSSLAQSCEADRQVLSEFAILVNKFVPILNGLRENDEIMKHPQVQKAVESLGKEFLRAKCLIIANNYGQSSKSVLAKQIENVVHDLGRSLGLVLFSSFEVCVKLKEKIGGLHRDLMSSRLDLSSAARSSQYSEIVSEFEEEEEEEEIEELEIQKEEISLGVDDLVLKLKYGSDEESKLAVLGLSESIGEKRVGSDWIESEGVIQALFARLGSSKNEARLILIRLLRTLVSNYPEHKEKMAEVESLSTVVRSLTREEEERREAVGLLLDLSEISAVRRRLGRIRGCIIMLVSLQNGDDPIASRDSGKLLNGLSSNTQNVLHMAEAGYFKPMVHYLKEGSDMTKILMATALSRMELTEQSRSSLGEDGAIEPLSRMFSNGKLEAKLSSLNALQTLSTSQSNVQRLTQSGILSPLLQLLFSVTSVLMTLREPASAILARIAESEAVLIDHEVAQQMLSLLSLSSPVIQTHLLKALDCVVSNPNATKIRRKMKESGAVQLLLPFLMESDSKIRASALNLLHALSKDLAQELSEQIGETHIVRLIGIVSSSKSDSEKAASIGILSYFPVNDKKVTEIFKRENLLLIVMSMMSSVSSITSDDTKRLEESVAGVLVRFTSPSDKKLQLYSADNGVISLLVKLLASESSSSVAKSRAATSLTQLSQNTLSLRKSKSKSKWLCVAPSSKRDDAFCEVHNGYCSTKGSFCLVKSGAVPILLNVLESSTQERGSDEAVLSALATLLHDDIWENGSDYIAKTSHVKSIVRVLESTITTIKAQERALWILERLFRVEEHRVKYGESAQVILIDLAQKGDLRLKPMIAKLLAQLELLQDQSSYF